MRISDWSSDVCSSDLLESLFEPQEFTVIGRQPKTQAAVMGKQPQENALVGHEIVKCLGVFSNQPLKQPAAALRCEAMAFERQRQALADVFAALALAGVGVGVQQARLTHHPGRPADGPWPDLFGEQLEQAALEI